MDLVLGIDLGTSYFKMGLFDREGRIRGLGRVFLPKDTDNGSRCEVPVERFWKVLHEGIVEACELADAQPTDIVALAYSSQASTFVLLDANDEPLTPLIVWLDRRAKKVYPRLRQLWDRADFLEVTGLGITGLEVGTVKLCWFLNEEPEIWRRVKRVMTITDYLVYSLTGETSGDEGTASLLGLLDLRKHDWWDDALAALGLSRRQMSKLLGLGTTAGHITAQAARRLGLKKGMPVLVGSLDHNIAAIGAGIDYLAPVSESTGTVLACLRYDTRYAPKTNCLMGAGKTDGQWYQLAFSGNGASVLEWYQQEFAPDVPIGELVRLAESVAVGADGVIALPSPEGDQSLEGFVHSSANHSHGNFVRAIMESTAATLADLVDTLCPDGRPDKIVATGGGARSDLWLQIKADLLGVDFVVPNCQEPACMGAALIAAVGAGWFGDLDEASSAWITVRKSFHPTPAGHKAYAEWHRRYAEHVGRNA